MYEQAKFVCIFGKIATIKLIRPHINVQITDCMALVSPALLGNKARLNESPLIKSRPQKKYCIRLKRIEV